MFTSILNTLLSIKHNMQIHNHYRKDSLIRFELMFFVFNQKHLHWVRVFMHAFSLFTCFCVQSHGGVLPDIRSLLYLYESFRLYAMYDNYLHYGSNTYYNSFGISVNGEKRHTYTLYIRQFCSKYGTFDMIL